MVRVGGEGQWAVGSGKGESEGEGEGQGQGPGWGQGVPSDLREDRALEVLVAPIDSCEDNRARDDAEAAVKVRLV